MSKTFIGGAVCQEVESEAPAAEEMLDRVVCSCEQFTYFSYLLTYSLYICLYVQAIRRPW